MFFIYTMSDFSKLSREPGSSIDPETWEVQINPLFQSLWNTSWEKAGKYIEPGFSQFAIDTARAFTSSLCESVLSHITSWKKVKRGNNKGFDILLPNNARLEAKMWRIGNSAVIKRSQLIFLWATGYYGLLYYRTTHNKPPSSFMNKLILLPRLKILWEIYLLKLLLSFLSQQWFTIIILKQ